MPKDNPYRSLVEGYAALLRQGAALPIGGAMPSTVTSDGKAGGKALIFSPHPDDECIIGGLPLRLMREAGMRIINVAVTLGSRKDRQAERMRELEAACACLGFDLVSTAENGLEEIVPRTRRERPERWSAAVRVIEGILEAERPDIIFLPHEDDWNRTHIGTHHLVADALAGLPAGFACHAVETEFWGAMAAPNLMVESSVDDVAALAAALSLHEGEVRRNPYHLRLPAWMIDNVRRGSELVQGQGEAAPDMAFATLYRLRRWAKGAWHEIQPARRVLTLDDPIGDWFSAR